MKKIKILSVLVVSNLLCTSSVNASFADGLVGGIVGGAVGSVITNEVYKNNNQKNTQQQTYQTQVVKKKRYVAPKNSDEMKIQKALSSLGFYKGNIDGEVNSFETRSAIKEMNRAYEIGDGASLKSETKDSLIFLGTLFEFDRELISKDNSKRTKGKKVQTALKIHGFYFDKVDGMVGRGTKKSISNYKSSKGLSSGSALDFEEEYQLVSSAHEINTKNIEDTINTLKGISSSSQNTNKTTIKNGTNTNTKILKMN